MSAAAATLIPGAAGVPAAAGIEGRRTASGLRTTVRFEEGDRPSTLFVSRFQKSEAELAEEEQDRGGSGAPADLNEAERKRWVGRMDS